MGLTFGSGEAGECRFECWIESGVFFVVLGVECRGFFVRGGAGLDLDERFGRFGHGAEVACSDGGEDGGTERGAFVDVDGDDGDIVHVGLELAPEH